MSEKMKRAIAAAVVAAVAVTISVLITLEFFVVRYVLIDGSVSSSDNEIIRAAKINMGGSIFDVDEAELRYAMDQDGRFELLGVKVEYPDTVILSVHERTKDAMVRCGGQILVLDSNGYVVEVHSTVPENCGIFVNGLKIDSYRIGLRIDEDEDRLQALKSVTDAVREQNAAAYISELNVEDIHRLWITTRGGLRVELGDAGNMSDKIMWLCSATYELERNGINRGTLDVSGGKRADYRP